jgi:hypothetical protein
MASLFPIHSARISRIAFWDVDPEQIDLERDSLMVMGRVFNYGTWADMVAVLKYYGIKRIKKEIIFASYLKKTALSFLCLITGLDKNEFKVIQKRQDRTNITWDV